VPIEGLDHPAAQPGTGHGQAVLRLVGRSGPRPGEPAPAGQGASACATRAEGPGPGSDPSPASRGRASAGHLCGVHLLLLLVYRLPGQRPGQP
jgi:hypothetical protein